MKKILLLVLLISVYVHTFCQKIPNKQEVSVWAPVNIKIDGKIEGSNKFQAYNHATDIFYTISNNDENLYLIIQATDPDIISRVFGKGVSFTIKTKDIEGKENPVTVTYPLIEMMPAFSYRNKKNATMDTTTKTADSIMIRNNILLNKSCKSIGILGIKGMDSLISVYNDDGIKAAGAFDNKKIYTCEFSIKLKLLNLSVNKKPKFSYQIQVNGTRSLGVISALSVVPGKEAVMDAFLAKANQSNLQNSSPTFFSGDYTLAKAP